MAKDKLLKKELIKYLPDNSSKPLLNKYKKTSKVILYPFDGSHGVNLEVKTYKSKLGTITKEYKLSCMCCYKKKQSLSIYHTFDDTDNVGFFEIGGMLMPINIFKTIMDSIYKEGSNEKS